jgi:hypothetical protein
MGKKGGLHLFTGAGAIAIVMLLAPVSVASVSIYQTVTSGDMSIHVNEYGQADELSIGPQGNYLYQERVYYGINGQPIPEVRYLDDFYFARDNFEVFNGYWTADSHSLDGRLALNITGTVVNPVDGDGLGHVEEVFTFTNTSGGQMNLHLYDYVDWDIDYYSDDYGELSATGVLQYDLGGATYFLGSPDPISHMEIQPYPQTKMYLDNMSYVADLRDIPLGVIGPDDLAGAIQFDIVLAAGDSATWTVYKGAVPEPGALSLLVLGGLASARRRRIPGA